MTYMLTINKMAEGKTVTSKANAALKIGLYARVCVCVCVHV